MILELSNPAPPVYFENLSLVHFILIRRLRLFCIHTKQLRYFLLCAYSSLFGHWSYGPYHSPWACAFFRLRIFSKESKASTFILPESLFLGYRPHLWKELFLPSLVSWRLWLPTHSLHFKNFDNLNPKDFSKRNSSRPLGILLFWFFDFLQSPFDT